MSYSDELYENITIGSSVITVSATDQDSGKAMSTILTNVFYNNITNYFLNVKPI